MTNCPHGLAFAMGCQDCNAAADDMNRSFSADEERVYTSSQGYVIVDSDGSVWECDFGGYRITALPDDAVELRPWINFNDPADPDWLVDLRRATHPFPAHLDGDFCSMCGDPAAHKVGEEHDLPFHNLSNYLCCLHFEAAIGKCERYPYEQLAGATREVDYSADYPTPSADTDSAEVDRG